MEQEADKPLRPTDLAEQLDCSVAYASQLLTGARVPGTGTALKIFDKTGHRFGPLKTATDEEIALLRKFAEAA